MVIKPARQEKTVRTNFTQEAHLRNFCSSLGVIDAPRCAVNGFNAGRSIVQQWAMFPRALKSADNSRSSMEIALRSLSENSKEFLIADKIVQGMFLEVPRSLVNNELFHDMICSLRGCLIRTPEQHLAAICADLGISVPESNRHAEKMAASVVEALHQPIHTHRMVVRRSAMYHSLRALPEGSREHKMAKVLVIRVTNTRQVPPSIQRDEGYRQVATTLRQGLRLG